MKKRIAKKIEKKQNETLIFMMPAGGNYRIEVINKSGCDLKRSARRKLAMLYQHYGNTADVASAISESRQRGRRPALLISYQGYCFNWFLIPERGFGGRESTKQFSARWQEFAMKVKKYCNDDEFSIQYCLR